MKRKQLELNISKCSVILFQRGKKVKAVREAINKQKCLKIYDQDILVKEKDDYLGDVLHEGGLAKCVEATVAKRFGRIFSNIIEISSILEDYRVETVGGLKSGLDIFEMAILPSLLNNSDVWIEIDDPTIHRLESIQLKMFRQLFAVPDSTPIPILRFELGHTSMKEKIDQRKLNFIYHIKTLERGSLAGEMYDLQVKYDFPGLVSEGKKLISMYRLPDIIEENASMTKLAWKRLVREAIQRKSEKDVQTSFSGYSKLSDKGLENENLELKKYIQDMSLRQARINFRIRSNMITTKMNMKGSPKFANELWKCDDCLSLDSQSHIMWCPAYAPLREGKSLKSDADLVEYFQAVIKLREDNSS